MKTLKKLKKINIANFRRILSLELGEKSKDNVIKVIKKLEEREEIVSAEPNFKAFTFSMPDPIPDPLSDPDYGNHLGIIKAREAWELVNEWNLTQDVSTVNVGVLDTGIDGDHEDLTDRIHYTGDLVTTLHRDFTVYPDERLLVPTANDNHGTRMAGIIGATGNNNKGICGVAWDVELISLTAYSSGGTCNSQDIIDAVDYAKSKDIPIINHSGGINNSTSALYAAIASYDGLYIAASGNNFKNIDTNPVYPASFDLPNIITVSATYDNDNYVPAANYGPNSVDIFAPGNNIKSTSDGGNYSAGGGTSEATAVVSGVAALIMSMKPDMEPIDVKNCILYSADIGSELNENRSNDPMYIIDDKCLSGGRLNSYEAVKMARDMWDQLTLTSNVSINGTVTASNNYTGREPYGAFDGYVGNVAGGTGSGHPATQWTATGTSGWIELNLNEYVEVSKIYFYNRESSGDHRAKDAFFTGTGGVALGIPFRAVNENYGLTIIEVNNVVTNVIRLDITSSFDTTWLGTNYIGANEIRILATPVIAPNSNWEQPVFTSNTNSDGKITSSGTYSNEQPWKAFNGTMLGGSQGNGDQWSVESSSGWLQLKLNYYIEVDSIVFYNGCSTQSNRTKDAKFTGSGGAPLGTSFTAPNRDFGHVYIDVGGVVTNVIQLNISSSYGSYVNASAIVIHATELDTQPSMQTWTQPIWSGSTNSHGDVYASGTYKSEYPWKAYNGTMLGGSGGTGDNWSVKATSGWLELTLDYPIYVQSIEFYSNSSGSNNRTKSIYFTGMDGVQLSGNFIIANVNQAHQHIYVGGIWTNIIRLNVTSSYGSYIGASMITINALY